MPDLEEGFGSLDEWASEAVRGANNWLVTLRNAEDEGFDPWSDQFAAGGVEGVEQTDSDTGLMSYSEGLTTLAMTNQFAERRNDWKQLQPDLYRKDIQRLLDDLLDENYTPEPYLSGDLTDDFTDAVSFSTSALIGALQSGITLTTEDVDVGKADIKEALERNLQWFLDNEVEMEDGAIAWAWAGSTDRENPVPENYFTFSATYPLCDLLRESENPDIQSVVEGYEDRIRGHLEETRAFLRDYYWEGDHWTGPELQSEEMMASCYAILALSYIADTLDEPLDETERQRVSKAINWLLGRIERDMEQIWSVKEAYICDTSNYTDGSGPYLFLDTISEFLNYDIGSIDEMDYSAAEVESIRDELAEQVLDKLWAGDFHYREKGFRHLQAPRALLQGTDPKANPTVIYTTQVGVETFLLNFLEEGTKLKASDSDATAHEPPTSVLRSGDAPTLEALHAELSTLFGDDEQRSMAPTDTGADGGVDISEAETLNYEFLRKGQQRRNELRRAYQHCQQTAMDEIPKLYDDTLKHANNLNNYSVGGAMETFEELYFEGDPEAFREIISNWLEQSRSDLLMPWIMEMERLSDLDDETIETPIGRKKEIDSSIDRLTSLDGRDLSEEALEEMVSHMKTPEEA